MQTYPFPHHVPPMHSVFPLVYIKPYHSSCARILLSFSWLPCLFAFVPLVIMAERWDPGSKWFCFFCWQWFSPCPQVEWTHVVALLKHKEFAVDLFIKVHLSMLTMSRDIDGSLWWRLPQMGVHVEHHVGCYRRVKVTTCNPGLIWMGSSRQLVLIWNNCCNMRASLAIQKSVILSRVCMDSDILMGENTKAK